MKLKNNQLTTREVELVFNVTNRTVVNWREGSTRITPIPFHTEERPVKNRIFFKWGEVKRWATKNGILIVNPIDYVVALRKGRKRITGK